MCVVHDYCIKGDKIYAIKDTIEVEMELDENLTYCDLVC